jgi:hypothetical protein
MDAASGRDAAAGGEGLGQREGRPAPRPATRWLGRWLAPLLFFAVGLATLDHYGTTWDELESYHAGEANLALLRAAVTGDELHWPWHELMGYQFVFDTWRGAVAHAGNAAFFAPGSLLGYRVANLLLSSLALALIFLLVLQLGGSTRLAALAALALALSPKYLAHSQNNPKDLIGLFVIALGALAVVSATRGGGLGRYALAGAALGLALANHVASVVLFPMAAIWWLAAGAGSGRRRLAGLGLALAVAPVAAFACWPWLWAAPRERLAEIVRRIAEFPVSMEVLYLGRLYHAGEVPWHYSLVSLVVATPAAYLLAALVAVGGLARRGAAAAGARGVALFALLWLTAILGAESRAPAQYDGVRHVLAALPPLAMLVALGVALAATWVAAGWRRGGTAGRVASGAAAAVGGVALLSVPLQMVALHPYHDAYLNEAVRAFHPGGNERRFELEYWGQSYKEGVEWLAAHGGRRSVVLVPFASWCARPYVPETLELLAQFRLESDPDRPHYLMFMTRRAWYTPTIERLAAEGVPVFAIRRQGSTLLEIHAVSPATLQDALWEVREQHGRRALTRF